MLCCFCFLTFQCTARDTLQKLAYFLDLTNLLEWVLYVTSAVFIGPFFAGQAEQWQWQCGAVAVFLAWFNLLLFLQRYDTNVKSVLSAGCM